MPDQGNLPLPLLNQTWIRLRRLMNEGFSAYLLSVSLFTASTILVSFYLHDRIALDEAITTEILDTVGTRQEPTDSQKEVGLIGSALARLNAGSIGHECSDPACIDQRKALSNLANDISTKITPILQKPPKWTDPGPALLTQTEDGPGWPELGEASICASKQDGTYLMIPAQARMPTGPAFSARINRAANLSDSVAAVLVAKASMRSESKGDLVQAYFISPDSLLRIWTSTGIDVCRQFKKSRLWAAKNYFSYFWDHPDESYYSTFVYIDYGGNGLVRTTCHSIELPRDYPKPWYTTSYPHGELLGIVCMDFKLADDQIVLMRRQLFFETAIVTFPLSQFNELDQIAVDVNRPPEKPTPSYAGAPDSKTVDAGVAGSNLPNSRENHPENSPLERQAAENRAIDMQPATLKMAEVQHVLHSELKGLTATHLVREITRVSFRDKTAFLLPLGSSGPEFTGLFFFPRSPRLPNWDLVFVIFGVACAGAAITSAIYSWRLQPGNTMLRVRLSLLQGIFRLE